MCFYDQHIFACGDYKWGKFRQHCNKEYRTGESCGMKLVMSTFKVLQKCRVCSKIEAKQRRIEAEQERIKRWKREAVKFEVSILRSEEKIQQLQREIQALRHDYEPRLRQLGSSKDHERDEDHPKPVAPRPDTSQDWQTCALKAALKKPNLLQDALSLSEKESGKLPAVLGSKTPQQLQPSSNPPTNAPREPNKSIRGRTKRNIHDRSSPLPDNGGGEEGVEDPSVRKHRRRERHFACPFFKHDRLRYSTNTENGVLYRSCSGPGFRKISDVKQHLRRKHSTIQCHGCWRSFQTVHELKAHQSANITCGIQAESEEGVDLSKMAQINSWGISWERIYEILWPGEPVPDPYFEEAERMNENPASNNLPHSQELAEFEAYSQIALPALIEANLRAATESQLRPIEEELKMTLMDTVRRCLLMVAENFKSMKTRSSNISESQKHLNKDLIPLTETIQDTRNCDLSMWDLTASRPDCQEPKIPENDARGPASTDVNSEAQENHQDNTILQGFDGSSRVCGCFCHTETRSDETSYFCDRCLLGICAW